MATFGKIEVTIPIKAGGVFVRTYQTSGENTVFGTPSITGPTTVGAPSGHVRYTLTVPRTVLGVPATAWTEYPEVAGQESDYDPAAAGPVIVVQDPPKSKKEKKEKTDKSIDKIKMAA